MSDDNAASILYRSGNVGVVQLPQRKYPAIAIQGDSFFILSELAKSALAAGEDPSLENELQDILTDLNESLQAIKMIYETALQENGIEIPYNA